MFIFWKEPWGFPWFFLYFTLPLDCDSRILEALWSHLPFEKFQNEIMTRVRKMLSHCCFKYTHEFLPEALTGRIRETYELDIYPTNQRGLFRQGEQRSQIQVDTYQQYIGCTFFRPNCISNDGRETQVSSIVLSVQTGIFNDISFSYWKVMYDPTSSKSGDITRSEWWSGFCELLTISLPKSPDLIKKQD